MANEEQVGQIARPALRLLTTVSGSSVGCESLFRCFFEGLGHAVVRAAPGAEISLTIGGRRFGPRTAGSDGLAVIPRGAGPLSRGTEVEVLALR